MAYSQSDEEKILQTLIKINPNIPKVCLEVGATDGLWLSNTAMLWKDQGWKAMLIEADDGNFINLKKNTEGYDVTPVHSRIEPDGKNSIDDLLSLYSFPTEIGVMSIDIDGDDYHIFDKMKVRPKILLIEFNATFPPKADVVGEVSSRIGCSARALARLSAEKNYRVDSLVGSNIVIVDHLSYPEALLSLKQENLWKVDFEFPDHSLSYLVQDYSGNWAIFKEPTFGFNKPIQGPPCGLWVPPSQEKNNETRKQP